MHCLRKLHFVCTGLLLLSPAVTLEATPQAAPASSGTPTQDSSSKTDKPEGKKYGHALSFPAVELRFRKEGQKKYKWSTYTNSRGEFALRVPQGSSYEILVHVKGFADQTRIIQGKGGGNEETVVFRMEPVKGDKK
jgi:hypothetical protein